MGVLYVGEDFEIVCWDVVSDPSTPNAWVSDSYDNLKQYVEAKEYKNKNQLLEKLEVFSDWLNE